MEELAKILNNMRLKRGSFEFESLEPKLILDENGKVIQIEVRIRRTAEKLIEELKKALEGTDIDEIKKKNEELNKVAMDLAGKVYEQAAKEAQAKDTTDNDTKDDDHETVEDATYEEK